MTEDRWNDMSYEEKRRMIDRRLALVDRANILAAALALIAIALAVTQRL